LAAEFLFFCDFGPSRDVHPFPTRRSSDLCNSLKLVAIVGLVGSLMGCGSQAIVPPQHDEMIQLEEKNSRLEDEVTELREKILSRSEEHTSELQSRENIGCRLVLEKKKVTN